MPRQSDRDDAYVLESDNRVARILEVYHLNNQIACAASEEIGIASYFFLQPFPPDRLSRDELYSNGYLAFQSALQEGTLRNTYDISHVLDDAEYGYVDETHYSDMGSLLVAQSMADVILSDMR